MRCVQDATRWQTKVSAAWQTDFCVSQMGRPRYLLFEQMSLEVTLQVVCTASTHSLLITEFQDCVHLVWVTVIIILPSSTVLFNNAYWQLRCPFIFTELSLSSWLNEPAKACGESLQYVSNACRSANNLYWLARLSSGEARGAFSTGRIPTWVAYACLFWWLGWLGCFGDYCTLGAAAPLVQPI